MHPLVERALEKQYDAFQIPAPRAIDGCPCCSDPDELDALVRTPRRQLTAEQLTSYAFSALLTVGDVNDLRHYWPRLAELSISGELLVDPEIVFSKPRHGDWRTWPDPEQAALIGLARAQIAALAEQAHEDDGHAIESWVCAFAEFLDDVTVILAPLLRDEPRAAASLLAWHTLNQSELARGESWDAFWEPAPANEARVTPWFTKPAAALVTWQRFNEPKPKRFKLWDAFWESVPANAARVEAWFAEPEVVAAIDQARTQAAGLSAPDRNDCSGDL
jgi:hypothetical protein